MKKESIFDSFADLGKSFSKIMPLAAIWMTDKPIQMEGKRSVRIEKGDRLRIENSSIVDVIEDLPATHKVIGCYGNIANSILFFELENLETKETLKLNIK